MALGVEGGSLVSQVPGPLSVRPGLVRAEQGRKGLSGWRLKKSKWQGAAKRPCWEQWAGALQERSGRLSSEPTAGLPRAPALGFLTHTWLRVGRNFCSMHTHVFHPSFPWVLQYLGTKAAFQRKNTGSDLKGCMFKAKAGTVGRMADVPGPDHAGTIGVPRHRDTMRGGSV